MNSIDDIDIRRLDLTLLILFERLLKTRNMSRTAASMGLTQSAVSHGVSRLRSVFDDALFVRKGAGVEPTPRALLLAPRLNEALASVRNAIQIGRRFDPAIDARNFSIAAPDTVAATLAPAVLAKLGAAATRCQVQFRAMNHERAAAAVVAGEADVAIGVFPDPPRETFRRLVARETFRIVARRGHPHFATPIDIEAYCKLDHMLVSHDRDARGVVDIVLDGLGRGRRIVAIMPQLMLAFAAASRSDAIITAPLSASLFAASLFPVSLHEQPIDIPGFDLSLLVRRDSMADPAIVWLSEIATEALAYEHPGYVGSTNRG
jgi:DNA-binding transcriptional LysR family regulator